MKKILSFILTISLVLTLFVSIPASAEGTAPTGFQVTYDSSNQVINYSGFDWSTLGENLIPDPTVSHFENGVYGKYAVPDENYMPTDVNPYYWWDKYIELENGFTKYYMDMADGTRDNTVNGEAYASVLRSPVNTSAAKAPGDATYQSLTNDGSGVLTVRSGGDWRYMPLPTMEANSYYVVKFNVKFDAPVWADFGIKLNTDDFITKFTPGNTVGNQTITTVAFVIYTGSAEYTDPMVAVYLSNVRALFDDFGVYKVSDEYAADCAAGVKLPDPRSYIYSPDYAVTHGATNSGDIIYDYTNIINDSNAKFGKNLITDPTVADFENGTYAQDGWWNNVTNVYHGTPGYGGNVDNGDYTYASPAYRGLVSNDTALSHTDDGSGAIRFEVSKANTPSKQLLLSTESLASYSYYVLSFWVYTEETYDATILFGRSTSVADGICDLSKLGAGWKQVVTIIYTGNKAPSKSYIKFDATAASYNTTVLFDDFALYKLNDMEYGKKCFDYKYVIADDVDYNNNVLLAADIDADGVVGSSDLIIVKKAILGIISDAPRASIDGNEKVDLLDYIALVKLMAELA